MRNVAPARPPSGLTVTEKVPSKEGSYPTGDGGDRLPVSGALAELENRLGDVAISLDRTMNGIEGWSPGVAEELDEPPPAKHGIVPCLERLFALLKHLEWQASTLQVAI